jgi:hypothetical protein
MGDFCNFYIGSCRGNTMRALPLPIYGENKCLLNIKWLPKEENVTRFTEKLMAVFKIFIYGLFFVLHI